MSEGGEMKTIARNTKRARRIFDQAISCKWYSYSSVGVPRKPSEACAKFYQSPSTRLKEISPGCFRVHITGIHWYEIESPA